MNRGAGPVGLGLIWIGAALMVVSTFLPLVESTGFFRLVQQNSLIQHNGWLLILVAIAVASGGFRARDGREWYWPFGAAVAAALGVVYWATNTGLRTLYPVDADGQADTSQGGMVGAWGIAIYVAGVGAALALIGSLMLRQGRDTSAGRKKCPDCAEAVLVDAQVCKHCGYRFDAARPAPEPPSAPDAEPELRRVRCHNCSAVQKEPGHVTLTTCESCGETMKIAKVKTPVANVAVEQPKRLVRCSLCDAEQKIPATASHFRCGKCRETMAAPPP